jgi:hypothetical protein
MHAMRRRMLMLTLAVSAFVAITSVAFEGLGLFRQDKLYVLLEERHGMVGTMPHHLLLTASDDESRLLIDLLLLSMDPIPAHVRFLEPRAGSLYGDVSLFVAIPHWLLFLLTAPWPLWWLARRRKQATRRRRGLCTQCGYDLRASPDRCPECGIEIARGMGNLPMHSAAQQHG